jgi:non-ribosomal peptide synthetase component F
MTAPSPDTALAEDAAAFERPLFDVFAAVAARQPDHLAVDGGTTRITYAELRDRALALGARVAARVPADGLVGILVPTTVLYPVAWLACLAARRPFLPLDQHVPPARNQAIIAEAGLAAVIVPTTASHLIAWLPAELPRIPMAAEPGPEPPPLPQGLPPSPVGMVLFTSGSTGPPKGVALHERSQLRKALSFCALCAIGPNDRLLSLNPPSTTAGASDMMAALLSGASLHPADLKRDGLTHVLGLLRGGGITVCATVPAVERAILAMDGTADTFAQLRILRLNSDTVTGSDVAALAPRLAPTARILLRYGMTESGTTIAQRLVDPQAPVEPGRLAVGAPVSGQTVSLEDANGHPVGPGETGELVVRGRYVALGHWVAGRLDTASFPPDPSDAESRCYRSGDMVQLRPDGMLLPIGRVDRQVKINGTRVEPGETEVALRGLPGVADAAVVAHGDADAPTLVAFVVPAPGQHGAAHGAQSTTKSNSQPMVRDAAHLARDWRTALAAQLPPQQVPARICVVPAIPLLPSLKPDLAALRALLTAAETPGVLSRVWGRLRRAGRRRPAASAPRTIPRDGAAP